jgi:alpha-glucoside transport system permease protein
MKFLSRINEKLRIIPTLVLTVLAIMWLTPTIGLLVTSFRPVDDARTSGWWEVFFNPKVANFTLDSYKAVFDEQGLGSSIIATFAIAIPATVLPILVAAFAAYGFTFLQFRGRESWFGVIIGLMVVPQQVALIPVLQMFIWIGDNLGIPLLGQYPAAWIVHAAFAMPLAIYILRNYMMTLPAALIEAARIDGASHFQIFWRLIIPMSVPALASFAIFQFLWVWNDFLIAFLFVGTEHPVLTTTLLSMLDLYGGGWQNVAAGSFISMAVPLLVFFSLQRYFVRGLTSGSVK